LYAGEITGVKFAALNFSGVPVEAFEIKLTQYATFAVQEHIRVNKRRLFHTRITSEEAGFRSGFTPTGSDPLAATRHLYEALTAPDSTGTAPVWTVRVTVPDDAASSYHGRLFQIRHELKVKVVTTLGSNNVRLTQPICVVNPAAAHGPGTLPKCNRAPLVTPALLSAPPRPCEVQARDHCPPDDCVGESYATPVSTRVAYSGHAQAVEYPFGGLENMIPYAHAAEYATPVAHERNSNTQATDYLFGKVVASAPPLQIAVTPAPNPGRTTTAELVQAVRQGSDPCRDLESFLCDGHTVDELQLRSCTGCFTGSPF
jgi:hypothetical protein